MYKKTLVGFLLLILTSSLSAESLLRDLLNQKPDKFGEVLENLDEYQPQILYTQIIRENGEVRFVSHDFNLDDERYFYPASTVKFPIALMALEKLNRLGLPAPVELLVMDVSETLPGNQEDERRTVAQYIHELFVVSDNNASNRLFEFVGRGELEQRLQTLGLSDVRISHRVGVSASQTDNLLSNEIAISLNSEIVHTEPLRQVGEVERPVVLMGTSYQTNKGEVVNEPFDFSYKNQFSLTAQQQLLRELVFPSGKLELTQEDREFLLKEMSSLPRESTGPIYDPVEYPDGRFKYLLAGGETSLPKGVKIYNKIGLAYGFATDNAYIVDAENGIEFFLSATIHTNENGRFNDDNYEYHEVAIPFLRDVGQAVYQHELLRAQVK